MKPVMLMLVLAVAACGGGSTESNDTDAKLHQYVGQYCQSTADCGGVLDCINVTCTEQCGNGTSCPGTLECQNGTCH